MKAKSMRLYDVTYKVHGPGKQFTAYKETIAAVNAQEAYFRAKTKAWTPGLIAPGRVTVARKDVRPQPKAVNEAFKNI